jgi:hypothetical protein
MFLYVKPILLALNECFLDASISSGVMIGAGGVGNLSCHLSSLQFLTDEKLYA